MSIVCEKPCSGEMEQTVTVFFSCSACCTWLYMVAWDLHALYLPCKAGTVFINAQLIDLNCRDVTWLVTIKQL